MKQCVKTTNYTNNFLKVLKKSRKIDYYEAINNENSNEINLLMGKISHDAFIGFTTVK